MTVLSHPGQIQPQIVPEQSLNRSERQQRIEPQGDRSPLAEELISDALLAEGAESALANQTNAPEQEVDVSLADLKISAAELKTKLLIENERQRIINEEGEDVFNGNADVAKELAHPVTTSDSDDVLNIPTSFEKEVGSFPTEEQIDDSVINTDSSNYEKGEIVEDPREVQKMTTANEEAARLGGNIFADILEYGHDEDFAPTVDEGFEPTSAPPGSGEKLAVLAERARQGYPLWHNDDRNSLPDYSQSPEDLEDTVSAFQPKVGGKHFSW